MLCVGDPKNFHSTPADFVLALSYLVWIGVEMYTV